MALRTLISPVLLVSVTRAAIRDRIILAFFVFVGLAVSLAVFFGSAALIEKDQFALVFAAGILRSGGLFALLFFIVFYVRRSFDARDVEYYLTRPVFRSGFVLSHAVIFILLASVFVGVIALSLLFLKGGRIDHGFLYWIASLHAEFVIMVCAVFFFSMVLSSATIAILVTCAFYFLSRTMGQILGIIDTGDASVFLSGTMQLISMVMPRLDLMAQSSWLIYGEEIITPYWTFFLAQGTLYPALLIVASILDLKRRQF